MSEEISDKKAWEDNFEMEDEYDFSDGERNPYAVLARAEMTHVVLDPDVSAAFPDSQSVNQALRLLIKAARSAQELPKAS